ncbi:MAG: agmatinase [Chloroflexota bacterium]
MTSRLTVPVPPRRPTFLLAPACDDLAALDADVAVLGVPHGTPYDMANMQGPSAGAPRAVREQSVRYAGEARTSWDFTFGGTLFNGAQVRIADCGDVFMLPGDHAGNSARATAAVNAILDRGAFPLVLGGDHSIPIPVMRAFEGRGDLCVVQFDAHIDWREERFGVREGLSSIMRRGAELACVTGMAQIGMRGIGSAREEEARAAEAWGSVIIPAADLHRDGPEAVLERIPAASRYYLTLDMDGMDPAIAPGVNDPAFGGITYDEATALMRGLARKGRIAGFDLVEIVPAADVRDLTSYLGARLALNLLGAMAWTGQFGG